MTRSFLSHCVFGQSLAVVAVLLIALAGTCRLGAAISLGPAITNAAEYEAEQSNREKLRVGKLRYEQKQQRRAAIVAGMEAQLRVQQQLVVMPPRPAPGSEAAVPSIWHFPPMVFAILAVILLGAGIFLKYLRSQQSKTPS